MKRRRPMQRSVLKRGGKMKRKPVKRSRPKDDAAALAFRDAIKAGSDGRCRSICGPIEAHHLCPRGRARGHRHLHDPSRNGAALGRSCHAELHGAAPTDLQDWIKPSSWRGWQTRPCAFPSTASDA